MMVNVLPITFGTPEYDESIALRTEVLRKPLGLEFVPEQLATEWTDVHLAAFAPSGKMVGILLLTPLSAEAVKMRQVAVAPDLQGTGVGRVMVAASEEKAREMQFQKITLHARDTAVPFYLKLGYHIVGEGFMEVGIPHHAMEKSLV